MLKNVLLALLAAMSLAGCISLGGQKPESRNWTTVECGGFKGWEDCKKQASRDCPNGFDVANQVESLIHQKRQMEYACKSQNAQ